MNTTATRAYTREQLIGKLESQGFERYNRFERNLFRLQLTAGPEYMLDNPSCIEIGVEIVDRGWQGDNWHVRRVTLETTAIENIRCVAGPVSITKTTSKRLNQALAFANSLR